MFQKITKHRRWKLTVSILSLSLLTVMAGAAVAPALNLIAGYFRDTDPMFVLMGYSSALNMGGGVIATLIAGALAAVSWRLSFLVYLLGLISVVLCLAWMPNEYIHDEGRARKDAEQKDHGAFRRNYAFVIGMFLLMVSFFIYPANFAIETAQQVVIDQRYVAVIMAMMDVFGFFGGLAYVHLRRGLGSAARFLAPVLFFVGYALLQFFPGWAGTLAGSFLVGFANGVGVPLIISTASKREGSRAAATVMPLISMALYLAQFTTPFIAGSICALLQNVIPGFSSYSVGMAAAVCFLLWSVTIPASSEPDRKPSVRQEAG